MLIWRLAYRKESVLFLLETGKILIARCLGELAIESIRPAMIVAFEDLRATLISLDDREGTMSANIVEAVDVAFAITTEYELEASDVEFQPVTWLCESDFVSAEQPFPGEDGTTLKLIHLLRCIPVRG